MNRDEKIILDFLKNTDGKNLVFEPNGNIPPDFLLNSNIAIEVRRLNQHFFSKGKSEGLETLSFQLLGAFKEVLVSFDSFYSGKSFWVSLEYRRPFTGNIKQSKKEIRSALSQFFNTDDVLLPFQLRVNKSIDLEVRESSPCKGKLFRLGGLDDNDAGGFVISSYVENIKHCILEKSEKIKSEKNKYHTWWLYLVDHLNLGVDSQDIHEVRNLIDTIGEFDKLVLISYEGDLLFEIDNMNPNHNH